jgi:hypothetical protein
MEVEITTKVVFLAKSKEQVYHIDDFMNARAR